MPFPQMEDGSTASNPQTSSYDQFAVWQLLGFTQANNDAEVMLNTNTPIGLTCNGAMPSHNLSTSTPLPPGGNGHDDPLHLWYEDIYKYLLID